MTIINAIREYLHQQGIETTYDKWQNETAYLYTSDRNIIITIHETKIHIINHHNPSKYNTIIDLNDPHSLQDLTKAIRQQPEIRKLRFEATK